jgi:hypothetical protein
MQPIKIATHAILLTTILLPGAFAKPGKISVEDLTDKSDCIVQGTIQKTVEFNSDNKPSVPEKIRIVSVAITKKIKSKGMDCNSVSDRVDIVVSGGPTNWTTSEPCDIPEGKNMKDFYLRISSGLMIPTFCHGWAR